MDAATRNSGALDHSATAGAVVIRTEGLRKAYSQRGAADKVVFDGIDLTVRRGEFVAILGRSGGGKSTLLRILAGAAGCDSGRIDVLGANPRQLPPGKIVLVFQDYSRSLLPWRNAAGNIRFGLERLGLPKAEMSRRVSDALARVKLDAAAALYPAELSGGMQQRVQLARAIAVQPEILFLDEPFGSLDALTRYELEDELQRLCADGVTAILVTHDVDEAVYLADRVVMLGGGPAAITLDLPVDLPRPRSQERTKSDPRFVRLRTELLGSLLDGR